VRGVEVDDDLPPAFEVYHPALVLVRLAVGIREPQPVPAPRVVPFEPVAQPVDRCLDVDLVGDAEVLIPCLVDGKVVMQL